MSDGAANGMTPAKITTRDESRAAVSEDVALDAPRASRQFLALFMLNLRQMIFSRYVWVLLFIGGLPLVLAALFFISMMFKSNVGEAPYSDLNQTFQIMFRTLYIHFIIFFIANIFGFSLIRKELDDRTLHYLYLQPVSRTLIILSKFASYLVLTWTYLSLTFLLTYLLLQAPYGFGSLMADLFERKRAFSLMQATGVMFVALLAYGSISMVMGSFFKSGGYAVIFLIWETALPYLPASLKFFTVSHYLQALSPERSAIPAPMFEMKATMPAYWVCALALTLVVAAFLSLSLFMARHTECRYSDQ